jgi:Glycosyl hydrolase family 47
MSKHIKNDIFRRSEEIFYSNIGWLLYSNIRIKSGPDRGAMYGWKNLDPPSYPSIYNEIVGYSMTAFSWIYSELGQVVALDAAKDASYWIIKNIERYGNLLPAGRKEVDTSSHKGDLSNLIYAFDNGMIMIGLLNLHKLTEDLRFLNYAEAIAKAMIERFYEGSRMRAVVYRNSKSMVSNQDKEIKWSMIPGAYHAKLALGLLELADLTGEDLYRKVSRSICNSLKTNQRSDGSFITNRDTGRTYLHPHLYACEGLIFSGLKDCNRDYLNMGLNGIKWAIKIMLSNGGLLPRSTLEKDVDQSDCVSQLLRLLILCRRQLVEEIGFGEQSLDKVIEKLHSRLLDFNIQLGHDKGATRYQIGMASACSWCTMFSMQALGLWNKRRKGYKKMPWINFYI